MFCVECGGKLDENAAFCTSCGSSVVKEETSDETQLESKSFETQSISVETTAFLPLEENTNFLPSEELQTNKGFCTTCGFQIPAHATAFCTNCGRALRSVNDAPVVETVSAPPQLNEKKKKDKKNYALIIVASIVAVAIFVAGGILLWENVLDPSLGANDEKTVSSRKVKADKNEDEYIRLINEGKEFLEIDSLEEAKASFEEAIDMYTDHEEAYLELAKVYEKQQDISGARKVLEKGKKDSGASAFEPAIERIDKISDVQPKIERVTVDEYPSIQVEVSVNKMDSSLTADSFTLSEDGKEFSISNFSKQENIYIFTYTTNTAESTVDERKIDISFTAYEYVFPMTHTLSKQNAQSVPVQLKQVDASDYPTIRVYYEIQNDEGTAVSGLKKEDFIITEKISSGEQLQREIRSVIQVKEGSAVAVDLVADISSSIKDDELNIVKQVMSSFVQSLHFENGDRAEILAFNTEVYEMAVFSQDPEVLTQGIVNMQIYGRTAIYDAILAAVNRVAIQKGSRCVIAFTDGQDNSSVIADKDSLIAYAKRFQIPIFLIGLGSDLDEAILREIAQGTGGTYQNIFDLHDLASIYEQVYESQRDLYVVEYVTDTNLSISEEREIGISLENYSVKGSCSQSVEIEIPDADNAGVFVGSTQDAYARISMEDIDRIISSHTAGSTFSFFLKDLQSGMTIGSPNSSGKIDASALICIPILYTIDEGVRNGTISMDTTIPFSYTYDGRGYLKKSDHGSMQSIRNLVQYMLQYSDNNAINSLMDYLTFAKINETCHGYGFTSVDIQRAIVANPAAGITNSVSPRDLVAMLEILDKSTALGQGYLRTYFQIQDANSKVGAGKYLGSSINFYNHNALRETLYNEIAIISDGQREYMISFMNLGGKWRDSAEAAADISKYIYDALQR